MWKLIRSNWPLVIILAITGIVSLREIVSALKSTGSSQAATSSTDSSWVAPSLYTDHDLQGKEREQVIYGEELIMHTSLYFGPKGSVAPITNGMNCQNCHLLAGKKDWGDNSSRVYAN